MISFNTAWKHKKTGDIVTLVNITRGIDKATVKFTGGNGISETLSESGFEKEFEPVILDFHSVKDQMAELCVLSEYFAEFGKIVMKRLDSKYFEVGKLVYISNPIMLRRDDQPYYGGAERPYVIRYMRPTTNRYSYSYTDDIIEIGIGLEGKKEDEIDYTFPIYLTRLDPRDAYWFLTRYDKPY